VSNQGGWDAASINGLPALNGPVVVVPYDARCPAIFSGERERIVTVLGATAMSVEHIGSTAVPGLAAKPIIDIDLVVSSSADEASYVPRLEAAGYMLVIREPIWHEHRMLKASEPEVNLHVFSPASAESHRHQVFRDWLRTHPDDRDLYGRTKLELATHDWADIRAYTDAKDAVIDDIYSRASAADIPPNL
jgi:GrpB-like predicted nucleotidyltransferase (UPF0157 family)